MPGKLSFLAAFGVAEANRALSAFTTMLVKFDPKTAGEAEISVMSQEVEKVARLKVEAAEELGQLKTHHDQLGGNRGRALTALQLLKAQADSAQSEAAKGEIVGKAGLVNHEIDKLDEDLHHDDESLAVAEKWLSEVTTVLEDAAQRLSDARRNLADAQRDMKRAEQERQLAQRQIDRQKELSGITGAGDSLGVALGAMKNAAAKAHQKAAANLEAAGAIKRASTSGSDVVGEVLAGAPQAAGSDPFARLNHAA